jgi:hypothetical protein
MGPLSSPSRVSASVARSLRGVAIAPVILAPLVVGGAALFFRRTGMLHRLFDGERQCLRRAQVLSRAIPGNDKHAIAAVLGTPQASSGAASPHAVFLADSWYYRLDSRHCIAIAIEFAHDIATDVRVLHVKGQAGAPVAGSKRHVPA